MGLLSGRKTGPGAIDRLRAGVRVRDAFESKPSYGPGYEAGVVAVLEDFPHRDPRELVGTPVRIAFEDRDDLRALIDDVRDHGPTTSVFFRGLTRQDVPIGASIRLEG
jgi:hypothetical protein